jgi:hypothetical protein
MFPLTLSMRGRLAVALIAAWFSLSMGQVLGDAAELERAMRERGIALERQLQRIAAVRPVLPPNGPVAYLSDATIEGGEDLIAQYALAPRLLDRSGRFAPHAFLLADYADSSRAVWPGSGEWRMIADSPEGVKVFVRE